MANIKYYINYDDEKRECGNCRDTKPFKKFRKNDFGYPRTKCRKCEREIAADTMVEARRKDKPDEYLECPNEDCGAYTHKFFKKCRKCKQKIR